jgi:hypothetical protein
MTDISLQETSRVFQDRQQVKLTSATDVWGIGQMM